jgi:hypothetical protein
MLALVPFILLRIEQTRESASTLGLPSLALAGTGLVGILWALVSANDDGLDLRGRSHPSPGG